jgi:ABC-type nitrate/sulfonate/bicarbonate transport system substrate-binding protein
MRHRHFLALAAIVALLAACSGAATPSPAPATVAPTSAESVAPTPTPNPFAGMTVTAAKAGDHSFDDVSLDRWIQTLKEKYDITLDLTGVDSADTSLRSVVSGATDLAVAMSLTGLVHLVQASGTDVKIIAADTYASDYQLVSKSSINGVSDLTGMIQGISAPGDASELAAHLCLNAQGFDYSTLQLVRIGGTGARVAALLAGQIDVGMAHIADAKAAVAKSNGALKILLDCGKVVGNYPVTGMVATGDWLKGHGDLAQVLVNEYVDAMRWASSDKAGYLQLATTWVPDADPAEAADNWDYFKSVGFWPVNGGIDLPSVETYVGYAAQLGILTGKIPTTDLWVDDSYVQNFIAAMGKQ